MNIARPPDKHAAKDYASDQEVRWCPGCGDYAIVKAMRQTLADRGAARENTVFISGIGCAARLPYYMSTYGFHTIHGRAPAIATGAKIANPALDIWVISGDGDALSIGGNHLLHLLRRNVDLQFLLFNNEIYGLTKGQYSPTSRPDTVSPSTPMGSLDSPVLPAVFALGAGARFVARTVDREQKHMVATLSAAADHKGTSFVEIFQNCIVYNDGVFDNFTGRDTAIEGQIHVQHGAPLVFGENASSGLRLRPGTLELEVVRIGEDGIAEGDILIHDQTSRALAGMLAALQPPFPVALGVLYCDPAPSYEAQVAAQVAAGRGNGGGDVNALLRSGHTWTVT